VALLDDDALVLDSLAYGELHLILSLLTPSSGVVRRPARRSRRQSTRQPPPPSCCR
jgi:recombinational DNA repair protein (RecF pathway)